jgi:hypothetical protein
MLVEAELVVYRVNGPSVVVSFAADTRSSFCVLNMVDQTASSSRNDSVIHEGGSATPARQSDRQGLFLFIAQTRGSTSTRSRATSSTEVAAYGYSTHERGEIALSLRKGFG